MRKVLVIITNPKQASYRLRIAALIQPLRQRDIELVVRVRPRRLLRRRDLLRSAGDYHAVILQRKMLDPWDARLLRRHARRILYDLDDALMFHPTPAGAITRWRTRRRFNATARIVDHVVAGNEYLADQFRRRGRSATVLPTVVDPAHYRLKSHASIGAVGLVWIGSRSTLPYLRELLPAINEAARRVPGLRLITIADQTLDDAELPIEHIRWDQETEAESLLHGDIGIAPTPSDPWTLGKCGFKIIQYMAAGLPVIASPVGANSSIVRPGETGLLVDKPFAWIDAMITLAHDVDLRRRMGHAGRERVVLDYSLNRAVDTWATLLSS